MLGKRQVMENLVWTIMVHYWIWATLFSNKTMYVSAISGYLLIF